MSRATGVALFLICLVPATLQAQGTSNDADAFHPIRVLLGKWAGTSSGQPGDGTVDREYTLVLNGRFIHVVNRSVYPPQPKNPKGETHQDVGYISFDRSRKQFVLRQFHVEGFVNQYVSEEMNPETRRWVFVSESIENIPAGWRARETYVIQGADEFEEVFELAAPGKDFELYSRTRLKRVR
jgi:hypothetical protein